MKKHDFVIKNDDFTISLTKTRNEALAGIATITMETNGGGLHKFETKESRLKVDNIEIISSTDFQNRENTVDSVGINTFTDVINIPKFNDTRSLIKFLKSTRNDLEKVAIKKFPSIKILLDHFEMTSGCLISRMSGSGSTCFALYEKKSEAVKAKNFLLQKFPKFWIKVAEILS